MQKVSASQGITAFIDKSGRSWNMATYCEMLTRTSTMQVFHQAKVNEYLAHGEDLVIVTYHTPTCKKCAPWGGKILSLTGETKGYPTMEEAKASGLFHPNCRHTYSLWIEFDDETNNRPEQIPAEKLVKDGDDGSIDADVGLQEALVYPRNGKKDFIPKNTEFSSAPKVIAGIGSHTEIREIQKLIDKYGGTKYDWMKKVAKIESARYIFDVHWYQKDNKQYKTKVKERRNKDGDRGLSV